MDVTSTSSTPEKTTIWQRDRDDEKMGEIAGYAGWWATVGSFEPKGECVKINVGILYKSLHQHTSDLCTALHSQWRGLVSPRDRIPPCSTDMRLTPSLSSNANGIR